METSRITAIIPAGGQPTNKILRHTNLPDTMLPINGKPVIGYILEDLLSRGITRSVIALHDNDQHTENYVTKKFGSKLQLCIIRNESINRGLGHAIHQALEYVDDSSEVLIYLGDTVYRGPLDFTEDFVVTSSEFDHASHWCIIEDDGTMQCYVNKPAEYSGNGQALAGIYFFTDGGALKATTKKIDTSLERYELYHTLDAYPKKFKLVPAEGWYDCGNIENYYQAKVDFLKIRSFNSLVYNDLYGSITKSSPKKAKLEDEINWYKNIPHELKVFSPRLIDYTSTNDTSSYTLEYYGYQSLADYYIFNHFDEKVWRLIIDRLFEILALFAKYTTDLPFAFYDEMYRLKTLQRIETLTHDPIWRERFAAESITINDKKFTGWPTFAAKLPALVQYLYDNSAMTFMHGDLHPANILFDPHSRIFKFIDPRGNFGESSVYGDHNYDIAKLRHSFSGRYDFIVSDLFEVAETTTGFTYTTFHESEHEDIRSYFDATLERSGYDVTVIKAIEALLFISMIPLHNDAPLRQQAMFVTGIQLLNSLSL
jgi:dTDP-glucose pyrophosphorylase